MHVEEEDTLTRNELTIWVSDLSKCFTVKNILKFKKLSSYKYIRFNIKTIKFRHKL